MADEMDTQQDPAWDAAWAWVFRQHEDRELDEPAKAELVRWLAAHPRHRAIYDEACRLWLMAGLVPPANQVDIPGADDQDA
jgi:transmembrane sensor